MNIVVFSGTSDGLALADWLQARGRCQITVCSATEYGGSLVPNKARIVAKTGRMNFEEMLAFLAEGEFCCAVDATHPYANIVTENIREATQRAHVPLLRLLREDEPEGPWLGVDSTEEAAHLVAHMDGNILLTTGSKELATFAEAIDDFPNRVYARMLPVEDSISSARALGLPVSHIIAMQGPFSQELNEALIREFDIAVMVTKASGSNGGFWEKVRAAQTCDACLVVIHRPLQETGYSFKELCHVLEESYGL